MLKLCKLRSRDRARDPQEAKNSILVLEMALYIALSVVKAREHESEVKLYVLLSSLDCCSTKNDSLKKKLPRSIKLLALHSSSESLMKVKTCGFLHASSSAMQWHPSVQPSPLLVQQQIFKQADVLHLDAVSSNRISGSGAFMTSNDAKSSSSLTHP